MKQHSWQRSFFTIWSGQAVSLLTSAIVQYALIWYLTDTTRSAWVLSMASIVAFLPQGILGLFIGVYIDRYDRKMIMIASDTMIALASLVLVIVASFTTLPIWTIMFVLFIRSVGSAFHMPSMQAVTPLLVPQDKLTKCAGYSQMIQSVSLLVSPALASVLYAGWSLNWIILTDVFGAAAGVLTLAIVAIPKLDRKETADKKAVFAEIRQGFAALKAEKGLFYLLWASVIFLLFYSPVNALFPLMSMSYFGGTAWHAGIAETAFAAGMLLGGFVLGVWSLKNRIPVVLLSIAVMGVGLTASGLLPPAYFAVFALLCCIMGLSAPFYSSIITALMQERISPEYLGRVFSLFISLTTLAMPVGLLFSGSLADVIGVNTWFLISGAAMLVIAVVCALNPILRNYDRKCPATSAATEE